MQVLCKASNTGSDIRCKVCGQGFLVYWTRSASGEREHRREEIVQTLREHHSTDLSAAAHPENGFKLPEWEGDGRFSAAALLAYGPEWATA